MYNYAIVLIGYNRINGLNRLYESIKKADYGDDNVTLIISLDYSGNQNIIDLVESFEWNHGEKRIILHQEKLGLKNHILKCGELLNEFDAIALFEDDILVSTNFYQFMKQSVPFYYDNKQVAGISLYSHQWNVNANLPFTPALSSYDIYFLQFAQSWGQIWLKNQWFEFIDWYKQNLNFDSSDNSRVPEYVRNWKETSWLKYHIKFCIENNKFFVYPYQSLTTCFADVGVHNQTVTNHLQVPIQSGKRKYFLTNLDNKNAIFYDSHFERMHLKGHISGIDYDLISFDLYGTKEVIFTKYLLSSQKLNGKLIKSYSSEMIPIEENIVNNIPGNDLYLYSFEKNKFIKEKNNNLTSKKIITFYKMNLSFLNLIKLIFYKIRKKW